MRRIVAPLALILATATFGSMRCSADDTNFKLALPTRQGQLQWRADGFKVVQSSAKPNGQEIGVRGSDASRKITFLGFLFVVSGQTPLTSAKCKDGVINELKKSNSTVKILATSEIPSANNLLLELVTYTARGREGKLIYSIRGFVATGDVCGDLEMYSDAAIAPEDPDLRRIFLSYRFDPAYTPQFNDVFLYAQILYRDQMYKAAAPLFELSLTKLKDDKSQDTMRRVGTDQAGIAYGVSGNTAKARSIFESAISKDPDYPMYYYNLACADAQDKNLPDARLHLKQAFQRKSNMLPGESLPDPSKDDSFLPYRNDKEFWEFVESV
jgi:hypothetical protein